MSIIPIDGIVILLYIKKIIKPKLITMGTGSRQLAIKAISKVSMTIFTPFRVPAPRAIWAQVAQITSLSHLVSIFIGSEFVIVTYNIEPNY